MSLAFSACQHLQLAAPEEREALTAYLADEARVVASLLDPRQLEPLGPSHWRYTVSQLQVFQLQIQPIVDLRAHSSPGRLELEAGDCRLEGLGEVEEFRLTLQAWLEATGSGLGGSATLAVTVSQPPLLKLIPARLLEATGRSLLAGILLGIRKRVAQQLIGDYRLWREEELLVLAP